MVKSRQTAADMATETPVPMDDEASLSRIGEVSQFSRTLTDLGILAIFVTPTHSMGNFILNIAFSNTTTYLNPIPLL